MTPSNLIIFDLDGVLVDTRETHFEALNAALVENGLAPIPHSIHLSTYDGLPTSVKLDLLGISDQTVRDRIWGAKQEATRRAYSSLAKDHGLVAMFRALRDRGFKIAVATNSIYETAQICLGRLGVLSFVDAIATPGEYPPKPSPAMYWALMEKMDATVETTLVVEDSPVGRKGAVSSGARVLEVGGRNDLSIAGCLAQFTKPRQLAYRASDLVVVIPMGGRGSRFAQAGYTFPKPLIEVNGQTMIQRVIENLNVEARFVFVVDAETNERYHMDLFLPAIAPGCSIIVERERNGAACAVIEAAKDEGDSPLLIANSDQLMEWDSCRTLYAFEARGIDGGIVLFHAAHPRWSYAALDEDGFVERVAEKQVISPYATTGVYYWRRASDFVKYARQMVDVGDRVGGEFYVAPVFNYAIADGKKIRAKFCEKMWGLGTPEDLNYYLERHKE